MTITQERFDQKLDQYIESMIEYEKSDDNLANYAHMAADQWVYENADDRLAEEMEIDKEMARDIGEKVFSYGCFDVCLGSGWDNPRNLASSFGWGSMAIQEREICLAWFKDNLDMDEKLYQRFINRYEGEYYIGSDKDYAYETSDDFVYFSISREELEEYKAELLEEFNNEKE